MHIVNKPCDLLREAREKECFPVINRGKLWYETLTFEQLSELRSWYRAWLDAPETLIRPNKPLWLNYKIKEEEILL